MNTEKLKQCLHLITYKMNDQNVQKLFPWINSGFVQKIIENSEQTKNVTLKSFDTKFAFKNGENFSSQMIALQVIFNDTIERVEKQKNFLIKIAIQSEDFAKVCEVCHIFEKEIEAYTKVLPILENCLDSIGISGRIAPRCFMTDSQKRMLVFEDLRENDFRSEDRIRGLDMEHLKLTLLTLAKLHAGTATLLLTRPEIFQWYKKDVNYKNAPMVKEFYNNIAKTVSNTVKSWPGFENISNKMLNIPQTAHDKMYDVYRAKVSGFNVITHGDMFMNNILFRNDQNEMPIDIRFVDFPLGRHESPAIDLNCLLYGSANSSIKQRDREHLIKYYHFELTKYLKLLNFPGRIPTLFEIQSEVFKVDLYSALIVLFILGLRYVHKSFDGGFFEVLNDGEAGEGESDKLFSHPECKQQLKYLLDLFDRRGYFEF